MKSRLLTMLWDRPEGDVKELGTGTGFTVMHEGRRFLITNLHNFRGRTSDGDPVWCGGIPPTRIRIAARNGMFSGRVDLIEPLYSRSQNTPLWLQHPRGVEFDVAALELTQYEGAGTMPATGPEPVGGVGARFDDWTIPDTDGDGFPRPYLRPADAVSIVGFPFGFHSRDDFPIWITGTIASEPEFDYDERPVFLVDARTREGQSGSPVVLYLTPNSSPVLFTDDSVRTYNRETSIFLGIYSGRLNSESDIGIVWKPKAIRAVLAKGVRPLTV